MSNEKSSVIETAKKYYDSHDAHTFYYTIWGGEEHHLGIYRTPEDSIYEASRRTIGHMASYSKLLGEDARVLDLGSGMGGTVRYLAKTYGCDLVGLNLSHAENELHRKKNKEQGLEHKIEVVDGNFEEVPYPDESFDIVWSQDAFLHSPNRRQVLSEAARVLRKGGELIFTDPMQTSDAYEEFLQPILKRIHLESMASVNFYINTGQELGLEFLHFASRTQQLANHYAKVLEETEAREEELRKNNVSQEYLQHMKDGLRNWVIGGKYGHLSWGIFIFRKPE
ncbi:MAG: methyltransferase domain-containing protein [Desulfohalobiaceae bacterium]